MLILTLLLRPNIKQIFIKIILLDIFFSFIFFLQDPFALLNRLVSPLRIANHAEVIVSPCEIHRPIVRKNTFHNIGLSVWKQLKFIIRVEFSPGLEILQRGHLEEVFFDPDQVYLSVKA